MKQYGICRICGCTDEDCHQCIEKTGMACSWVDDTHTLCSACVKKRDPVLFEIPESTPPTPCRGCGASVYWIITKAGKRMPVDADGTSHFATCPKANQFRRKP